MTRFWSIIIACGMLAQVTPAVADKKTGIKGRYLEVESGVALTAYKGGIVVLDPAAIISDKDKPVDTEAVRASSDDMLRTKLQELGVFKSIVSAVPAELPEGTPIMRMTTKLMLQHGSQPMRFFVGSGAGKSKLHIQIDLLDVRSGQRLAHFNGYGTGAGFWSVSGGNVQRMAKDDFQENYGELAELLRQHLR